MKDTLKWYDAHLEEFQEFAHIKSLKEYDILYRKSLQEPEAFWAEQAEKYLTWDKPWDFVLKADFEEARFEWFGGGVLNASYNCLDRHLPRLRDRVAYYWEGDDPEESGVVTYQDLYQQVNKLAAVLKSRGVQKGDRVVIYLPMIVELPVSLLACSRIGAIHCAVFVGLSAETLASRIKDCGAKVVLTADGGYRGGKWIPLKTVVDEAMKRSPEVETVIVYGRRGLNHGLESAHEVWWQEAVADANLPDFIPPEPMDAEDPLFILHTSGSTGKPKGMVHTHGGYLLYAAMTTRLVFDLKENEIFWCMANIDWITGHTYSVYGPLLNGLTSVLFEGVPLYPNFDRCWQIVEKYKVEKLYTTPDVIRSLAKESGEYVERHDITSLKLLGTVGEPITPEAWKWYYHHIGRDWAPIMDTWWQTETGGHMITPLPGVTPLKPGSCALPFFGVEPVILDLNTGAEIQYPDQEGALFIKRPWPGMARTVYNNHYQFKETYFSIVPNLFFTGDEARVDEDGYYWILGRFDDVITVSNHRLGTAEFESALVQHDQVAEAAVVGVPDPDRGQCIWAFVTLNTGATRSDELKQELVDLVRLKIGPIATIHMVKFASSLPKTLSGKILHRLLHKIALGQFDQLDDISTLADPAAIEDLIKDRG
ncbi:MAG: acetate--CoA ligase [Deltaproteobacteria bacterium]|nr:acetate--CoA ligase [Deltaproteobacteria bacterium]MBW2085924.1 acetate--CoA ligase [Deltaproteobacteria bacterium]